MKASAGRTKLRASMAIASVKDGGRCVMFTNDRATLKSALLAEAKRAGVEIAIDVQAGSLHVTGKPAIGFKVKN